VKRCDGLKFTLAVWHAAYLPRVYAYLHITLTARQASVTGRSHIRVLCCQALVKTLLVFLLAQRSNAQHIMRMCDRPSTATRR